ncbi:putative 2OG-Fe(II) oxygenase [Sphingomonas bacterium]|uniref:putative 2OG-Fe(II) oxygenase n=1 Tax=Sphingomonas bacterium TaxID=1895847 RepID=UPI0015760D56|nr:putative 2OG-Fe(II) oxygenase [Sphingomonas bacterium]
MTAASSLHSAHMAAVGAAQDEQTQVAATLFASALADGQADARFLTDYAAFASAIGQAELAASLYERAIAATPGDSPPLRLRHALATMDAGKVLAAIALLGGLTRDEPRSLMAWQALGAALHAADRAVDALAAFDRVVTLAPRVSLGLLSRARMSEELGRPATADFTAALAAAPDSGPARLGLAAAQAGAGQYDLAEATLQTGLARAPDWAEGWAALVSLVYRWQGHGASIKAAQVALAAAPRDANVATSMLRSIAAVGANDAVLGMLHAIRGALGDTLPLALIEAQAASETGDIARADAAFTRLAAIDDPVVLLARLRHSLRAGWPDDAIAIGEPMTAGPAARFAIPYIGTAWRMLGDPRHAWLEGDPQLVGTYDLGIDAPDLAVLAAELRTLHTARHAPFEQSMRGGTQTDGVLLSRQSPAIRSLRAAIERAVRAHIDQLPAVDLAHPTLSVPRNGIRFAGSWSVRLSDGGHHVNHVHSEGWLSSACYIALPDAMTDGGADDEAGWLTLGQPPVDLGLDLSPVRTVQPAVGQVTLFPSTMWHGTRPAPAGERLTVAFDVQPLT